MIYGYARVSSKGQLTKGHSMDDQVIQLFNQGCSEVIEEQYTAKEKGRPKFEELLKKLQPGDTLVVTKLDRFCRNSREGLEVIEELRKRNVTINILNMGVIANNPIGDLIVTCLLAFAQFERNLIIERTSAGKAIASQKPGYKEGRKPKFNNEQVEHALSLLSCNGGEHTYSDVIRMTGISRSTLFREQAKKRIIEEGKTLKEEDEINEK